MVLATAGTVEVAQACLLKKAFKTWKILAELGRPVDWRGRRSFRSHFVVGCGNYQYLSASPFSRNAFKDSWIR